MYFQVAQTLVRRANSDERNHSACRFTLSAERKKSLVRAESALSGFPDIPHADSSQSLLVFIRQVEVNLLRTISSAKPRRYFRTDLVAAQPDRRPDRRANVLGPGLPLRCHCRDCFSNNIFGRAAPTCVNRRNRMSAWIRQEYRDAVGGSDADNCAGMTGD